MATLLTPYVTLPLEVLAIAIGAGVLVLLVPSFSLRTAIPTAATVLLTIVTAQQFWSSTVSFDYGRTQLALAPGISEREACMIEKGHPELIRFARWITDRVPPEATVAYGGSFGTGTIDAPCFQFALLPRRMVSDVSAAATAQYVMYLDPPDGDVRARLAAERQAPRADRSMEFYSPWWALEHRD